MTSSVLSSIDQTALRGKVRNCTCTGADHARCSFRGRLHACITGDHLLMIIHVYGVSRARADDCVGRVIARFLEKERDAAHSCEGRAACANSSDSESRLVILRGGRLTFFSIVIDDALSSHSRSLCDRSRGFKSTDQNRKAFAHEGLTFQFIAE